MTAFNPIAFRKAVFASDLPGKVGYTALALAQFSTPGGAEVWPSLDLLSEMTGNAPDTLKKHLRVLTLAGLIQPVRGGKGRATPFTRWVLTVPANGRKCPDKNVRTDESVQTKTSAHQKRTDENVRSERTKTSVSPTPPNKEEETREETREQHGARTHTHEAPGPAPDPEHKAIAAALPSVSFPVKPGPPRATVNLDLHAEVRQAWIEAHDTAGVTLRPFTLSARKCQEIFETLTAAQRETVWESFRFKLADGPMGRPDRYLIATAQGIAAEGHKPTVSRGRTRPAQAALDTGWDLSIYPKAWLET